MQITDLLAGIRKRSRGARRRRRPTSLRIESLERRELLTADLAFAASLEAEAAPAAEADVAMAADISYDPFERVDAAPLDLVGTVEVTHVMDSGEVRQFDSITELQQYYLEHQDELGQVASHKFEYFLTDLRTGETIQFDSHQALEGAVPEGANYRFLDWFDYQIRDVETGQVETFHNTADAVARLIGDPDARLQESLFNTPDLGDAAPSDARDGAPPTENTSHPPATADAPPELGSDFGIVPAPPPEYEPPPLNEPGATEIFLSNGRRFLFDTPDSGRLVDAEGNATAFTNVKVHRGLNSVRIDPQGRTMQTMVGFVPPDGAAWIGDYPELQTAYPDGSYGALQNVLYGTPADQNEPAESDDDTPSRSQTTSPPTAPQEASNVTDDDLVAFAAAIAQVQTPPVNPRVAAVDAVHAEAHLWDDLR